MPTYGLGTIQHSNMARDPQNEGPETREVDINVEGLDILSDAAPDMASLAEDLKRFARRRFHRFRLKMHVKTGHCINL